MRDPVREVMRASGSYRRSASRARESRSIRTFQNRAFALQASNSAKCYFSQVCRCRDKTNWYFRNPNSQTRLASCLKLQTRIFKKYQAMSTRLLLCLGTLRVRVPAACLEVEVDRGAADGDDAVLETGSDECENNERERNTDEAIVLAADGLRVAAVAASTNNGDGVAGETDGDVHALDDDAEQAEEGTDNGVRRLRIGPSERERNGHDS